MSRVKHLRVVALAVALVFLFSSVAFAAVPQYVYFQSGSDMVKVDYAKAVNDAMNNDNTLYNAVKQYVGEAEETGAPVIVETDDQKVLDYQKALGAGKRFADIVNDPAYQANKPEAGKELRVENGQAVIGDVQPAVVEISSITQTDTLGVVEIVAAGTTAEALQAAITPACTVVAKEGVPNTYTVTIQNAAYDQEITLQFAAGFQLKAGVNNKVKWASPKPEVVSVSAINATTIEVTLAEAKAGATADDFTVTVADQAVAVTAVAANADNTKYTLTVDLTGKEGTLKVNGTAAAAAIDFAKPVLANVQALNATNIKVTFSEEVDKDSAELPANYKLYSMSASKLYNMAAAARDGSIAVDIVLQADKKSVVINILDTKFNGADQPGFVMGGLTNADYILYVSNVKDKATPANTIVPNSNKQFTGTTTPDATGPVLSSAQYDNGLQELTLSFSKNTILVDKTKISFKSGTNSVALSTGDAYSGTDNTRTLKFKLSADTAAAVGALTGEVSVVLAAGAVKDSLNNANALTSAVLQALVRPVILSASYDENTSLLSIKFSKIIDITSITDLSAFTMANGANNIDIANKVLKTTANSDTIVFDLTVDKAKVQAYRADATKDAYKVTVARAGVRDLDGNDLGENKTASVAYTRDDVKPALVSATFNNKTELLTLTVSEAVKRGDISSGDVDVDKISISVDNGATWKKLSYDNNNGYNVTKDQLNTDEVKEDGANLPGRYLPGTAIKIKNTALTNALNGAVDKSKILIQFTAAAALTDVNGNAADAMAYDTDPSKNKAMAIQYVNEKSPKLNSAKAISPSLISVTFDKEMDVTTLQVKANYSIVNNANPAITGDIKSIEVTADKKGALLTLNKALSSVAGSNIYTVTVTGVTDSAGNAIDATANKITNMEVTADTTPPAIVSVAYVDVDSSNSQTAGDKIVVNFSEPITLVSGKTLADVFVMSDGKEFGSGATISTGSASNQLVVTLGTVADDKKIVFGTTTIALVDSDGAGPGNVNTAVKDLADNNSVAASSAKTINVPAGAAAPKLMSVVLQDVNGNAKVDAGDKVVLTFDQTLATKADFKGADGAEGTIGITFADTAGDDAKVVATVSEAVAQGTQVTLTLNTLKDNNGADITVVAKDAIKISVAANNTNVVNLWGQSADATVVKYLIVAGDNGVAPYLVSVTKTKTGNLEFLFSEPVQVDVTNTSNGFMTAINGDTKFKVTEGTVAGDSSTLIAYKKDAQGKDVYTTVVVKLAENDVVDQFSKWVVGYEGIAAVKDITNKAVVRNTTDAAAFIIEQ